MSGEAKIDSVTKEIAPGVIETTTTFTFPDGSVKVEKSVRTQTVVQTSQVVETKIPRDRSKRMSSRNLNVISYSAAEESGAEEAGWVRQQRKAFIRWCNAFLAQRGIVIESFETDLQDGIVLINLLECLSGKQITGWTKNPRMKIQKCVNIQAALDFITKDQHLRLESIGPQDIYEGKSKLILGLIWTLILHFQLASGKWGSSGSVKGDLLEWCNKVLATQGLKVVDFKTSWSDGRAFYGLITYLITQYGYDVFSSEGLDIITLLTLCFGKSYELFQIPQLLDAEDMQDPDEQAVMSYISYFRQKDKSLDDEASAEARRRASEAAKKAAAAPKPVVQQQEVVVKAQPVEVVQSSKVELKTASTAQLTVVPQNTTAEGEGLRQALCGKRASFVVTTRDKVNQILYIKGTQIGVTLEHEGAELKTKVSIADQGDANYVCEYLVNKAGIYYITIFCNGTAIRKEKWWVKLRPSEPAAAYTEAKGNGLSKAVAGIPAEFKVITRDQYGNACDLGGASLSAFLVPKAGGPNVDCTIVDRNDGTYDASYVLERIGQYTLTVLANKEAIKNSPFLVKVTSEGVDSGNTTASGAGLHKATAGVVAEYTVKTADRFGNVIEDPDAVIQANLEPIENDEAEPVECSVRNNHDGTYTVTYTPITSGNYHLNTRCNGNHITDSPFEVSVASGPAVASTTIATGDGLRNAACGKPAKFQVKTKDEFRNIVSSSEGVAITGSLLCGSGNDADCVVKFEKNGTWNCEYVPKVAGNFPLQVTLNGKDIRGSKFNVTVVPGGLDTTRTEAHGEGLAGAKAGETARFYVVARDQFGNEVRETDASRLGLTASVEGPENVECCFSQQQRVKNVLCFPAEYLCVKPGTYTLKIQSGGKNIKGSPFEVNVQAGKPSAGNCHAEGEGLHTATAGHTAEFVVMVCDEWGNVLRIDERVTSVTTTMDGPAPITPKLDYTKDDGSLVWSYTPTVASTSYTKYALSIKLDGKDIVGSPFAVFVSPAALSAHHCYAEGEGLSRAVAGKTAQFTVHTRDAYGNSLPLGGQKITGQLSGPANVTVKFVDHGDGTYGASYYATVAGRYTLKVQANGDDIKDSPFAVTIAEGALSAANTTCEGEGLHNAVSNQISFFRIITRDAFDNPLTVGGARIVSAAQFENKQNDPANFNVTIKDNGNGTYSAEYVAQKKGDYRLIVTAEGDPVKASPFKLKVASGAPSNNNTVAEGEGLRSVVCGKTAKFIVITKDNSGNKIEQGGASITGKLTGAASITVVIIDNGDGTYSASYDCIIAGQYSLDVFCDGAPIKDSPFAVTAIPGGVDHSKCIAVGEGLEQSIAGVPASFKVITKDQFGNDLKKGGEKITAKLQGSTSNQPINATIKDNGDGTYNGNYVVEAEDTYKLSVDCHSKPIKDSPFTVKVLPGDFDASKSTAEGDGLRRGVAGETAAFVVQARDKFGNKLRRGGAKIDGSLSGPENLEVTIRDNNDGTYGAQYKPRKIGAYTLKVQSGGVGIVASPFKVRVEAGEVQGDQCIAEGDGLSRAVCGDTAEFTIEPRDAFGNPVEINKISGTFTSVLTYPSGETLPVEIEGGDTLYLCQYSPTLAGKARLDILYNGGHIHGSPFAVTIAHGDYSGATSELEGALNHICGENFSLLLRLKDRYGNLITRSVDATSWKITLNPSWRVKVVDNGDGTYTLEFTAFEKAGKYSLAIILGKAGALKGSPFSLIISPGAAHDGEWIEGPKDTVAGKERELKLQAIDAWANKLTVGGSDFRFTLEGPDAGAKAVVKDNDNGTYSSALLLTKAGKYVLHVLLNGKDITKSPWRFEILPGQVKGGYCIALGAGLETATAGEEASFLVQSRDAYDNEITTGGATVIASLQAKGDQALIKGVVTDNKDGIYSVVYVAQKSTIHTLTVSLNGEQVQKSPFTVKVLPGRVSSAKSSAIGEAPKSGKAGAPYFKLQARDRFGNDKVKGGDDVKVYLTKPIRRPATVLDNNDGTYDIKYPYGIEEGEYDVEVELANERMSGGSIPSKVKVNETDPLEQDKINYISEKLPNSSKKMVNLLLQLSPEERDAFIKDLKSLQG